MGGWRAIVVVVVVVGGWLEGGTGKLFSEPYCPLQTTPDATERLPISELLCCLFPASCEGSCVVLDTQVWV